jgi:hypothetical protein
VIVHLRSLGEPRELPASLSLPAPPAVGVTLTRDGARYLVERVEIAIDGEPAATAWISEVPHA